MSLLLAEANHGLVVGHIEGDALGHSRDPGIARRAIEPVEQGALLELPGERVLPAAAPDQQHIHSGPAPLVARMSDLYCMVLIRHGRARPGHPRLGSRRSPDHPGMTIIDG